VSFSLRVSLVLLRRAWYWYSNSVCPFFCRFVTRRNRSLRNQRCAVA